VNDHGMRPTDDADDAQLRALAARLGARAAASVDVERVARGVVDALRRPVSVPLPRRLRALMPPWARVAAALVVLAGGGVVARTALHHPAVPTRFVSADLAGLDADELSELLATLDQTLGEPAAGASGALDELDADQLDQVLQGLEG